MSITGAGVHEDFAVTGRRVELRVDPATNMQHQKPDDFITASTVKVYQPFIVAYENSAEVSAAQIDQVIYTVPTGYKLRVLDFWCMARASEASATVKLTDGTSDIGTAIICAVDAVVTRMAAGFDDTKYELAAAATLTLESAGGTNGPACNAYALVALMPA